MTQPALFEAPRPEPVPPAPRTYWENRGPRDWRPVVATVRYGRITGHPALDLPHLRTGSRGPMNVLIRRADGSTDVVPVRTLRTKEPR